MRGISNAGWSRRRMALVGGGAAVAIALGLFVAFGGAAGAGEAQAAGPGGPGGGAMPPMPVDADSARRQAVTDAVRALGRIEAVQAIELRPDAEGRVSELLFQEGQ